MRGEPKGVERTMLKKFGLAAVLLVAGAVPSFAADTCTTPVVPAAIDGATVAIDVLRKAIADTKAYIAASDAYQQCIVDYVATVKADADKNKTPVDAALIQAEAAKGEANQASKQKAGDDINTAIGAYKKAHPT